MRHQPIEITFPLGGLHRRFAFQDQPPYTTVDAINVRPQNPGDSIGNEMTRRIRGGTRPGLISAYDGQALGDIEGGGEGQPVRLLYSLSPVVHQDVQSWTDLFETGIPSPLWTWTSTTTGEFPSFLFNIWPLDPEDVVIDDLNRTRVGGVRERVLYDKDRPYTIRLGLVPYENEEGEPKYWGSYYIFACMDAENPNPFENGLLIDLNLVFDGDQGNYGGHVKIYSEGSEVYLEALNEGGGVDEATDLVLTVNRRNVKVMLGETTLFDQEIPEDVFPDGDRVGFGLHVQDVDVGEGEETVEDQSGVVLLDYFQFNYISEAANRLRNRLLVVASAGGLFYVENENMQKMDVVSTNVNLASDRSIQAAERLGLLFIADYSDIRIQGGDGEILSDGGSDTTLLEAEDVDNWADLPNPIDAAGDVVYLVPLEGPGVDLGVYEIESVGAQQIEVKPRVGNDLGGSGLVFYRIERGPKVYDPVAGTIRHWFTNFNSFGYPKGFVPVGCPLICLYRDRIVMAGASVAPHLWYMSRQGDPYDWDYSEEDFGAAVAGQLSDAGRIGEPITAIIPHSDDYLLFGCPSSLWVLRGDPSVGGVIDNLSRTIGIVGMNAWCHGPAGEVFFLSYDGIYALPPGAGSVPQSLGREKLPFEMTVPDIQRDEYNVFLSYDVRDRGIHIYIVPPTDETDRVHWFFYLPTMSFWKYEIPKNSEPGTVHALNRRFGSESAVFIGGKDGIIRAYRDAGGIDTDSNNEFVTFDSHVWMGPFRAPFEIEGILHELHAFLADGSADVRWSLHRGDTPEEAYAAEPFASGQWSKNANLTARPRMRGKAFYLKLENVEGADTPWALESITARLSTAGRLRL